MTSSRTTNLLAALLVIAAIGCGVAWSRLNRAVRAADQEARANAQARGQLAYLASASGAAVADATGADGIARGDAQINRRLRDAATAAGVAENLVSIEPGEPNPVPGGDHQEMLVFLRLERLELRQLLTFLHALAVSDAASRAKTIELSMPQVEGADETWMADVTLAYVSPLPQERSSP